MSFDFPFVRLFGVRQFVITLIYSTTVRGKLHLSLYELITIKRERLSGAKLRWVLIAPSPLLGIHYVKDLKIHQRGNQNP